MKENRQGIDRDDEPHLEMTIDMAVLEHLGLKMYTSLPAVISEYVANAWDAGATNVEITVPEEPMSPSYEITIKDDGLGMTHDDVNEKFLVVGRNRREEEDDDQITVRGNERPVMGRKGIGKLAGFGIAGIVSIETWRDNEYVKFEMDYQKMKEETPDNPGESSTYTPTITEWEKGDTSEYVGDREHGTEVTLRDLHKNRDRRPSIPDVRRRLARRFGVLGDDFDVRVNGRSIQVDERELRDLCEFMWEIDNERIAEGGDYTVNGWIGTTRTPVSDEIGNGIVVMARGKLVQEPRTFVEESKGFEGQLGLAYILGEVHADFIDDRESDLIATDRNSLVWEEEPAKTLESYLQQKVKDVCRERSRKKREERMEQVRATESYQEQIKTIPEDDPVRQEVDNVLAELSKEEDFDDEKLEKTTNFLASGTDTERFLRLIRELNETDVTDAAELMGLFEQWEVWDALELMRLARGRLETIAKFRQLIESEKGETPNLNNFLAENPWIIDPRWDYVHDETRFSDELGTMESTDSSDSIQHIDTLCLGYGQTLNVLDLKTPESKLERADLEHLEERVDYVEQEIVDLGRGGYQDVDGYLIGGSLSDRAQPKADRLALTGIYVRTYEEMQEIAKQTYRQFVEIFERRAERLDDNEKLLDELNQIKSVSMATDD